MSPDPSTRAAELAARQVEAIVAAAQEAAEKIRAEAERERAAIVEDAEGEATRTRERSRRDAEAEIERARVAASKVADDARTEADERLSAAQQEAEQRVTTAQRAADEALTDARAMSHGLRRLGAALGDQAERILRDVQAAHKRLSADLRVAGGVSTRSAAAAPVRAEPEPADEPPRLTATEAEKLTRLAERERAAAGEGEAGAETARLSRRSRRAGRAQASPGGSGSRTPIDDFEVPNWVEPGS